MKHTWPNRVAGEIALPGSHTTGHAGPRPAVPDSPEGQCSALSLPRWLWTKLGHSASSPAPVHPGSPLPAKFSPSRAVLWVGKGFFIGFIHRASEWCFRS
jgi:hypothetical protein